jgi:HAD superfamily hydrolase (TIGR01450 family)
MRDGNRPVTLADLLESVRLIVFDLDGTLYRGEHPLDGARETVDILRRSHSVAFLTNNSSHSRGRIYDKLIRLGFSCDPQDVHCSTASTAAYLSRSGIDRVYVIGSPDLIDAIVQSGVAVVPADRATALVVGMDKDFTYTKIADALTVLVRGGPFVVCNEDASFPAESGRLLPGCGAMVGAIRAASGRAPDVVIGKPEPHMLAEIATRRQVPAHQILAVGDQWSSDVRMARNFGCPAVWLHDRGADDAGPTAPGIWHIRSLEALARRGRSRVGGGDD